MYLLVVSVFTIRRDTSTTPLEETDHQPPLLVVSSAMIRERTSSAPAES